MLDPVKAYLDLSKECITEYVTSSGMVTSKPCFIFDVVVSPTDADTKSIAYLRNGELVTSPILINFSARNAHPLQAACLPIYFTRGLYVELNTNVVGVTVHYLIDSDI